MGYTCLKKREHFIFVLRFLKLLLSGYVSNTQYITFVVIENETLKLIYTDRSGDLRSSQLLSATSLNLASKHYGN